MARTLLQGTRCTRATGVFFKQKNCKAQWRVAPLRARSGSFLGFFLVVRIIFLTNVWQMFCEIEHFCCQIFLWGFYRSFFLFKLNHSDIGFNWCRRVRLRAKMKMQRLERWLWLLWFTAFYATLGRCEEAKYLMIGLSFTRLLWHDDPSSSCWRSFCDFRENCGVDE